MSETAMLNATAPLSKRWALESSPVHLFGAKRSTDNQSGVLYQCMNKYQ
jgi:hypothetical protein